MTLTGGPDDSNLEHLSLRSIRVAKDRTTQIYFDVIDDKPRDVRVNVPDNADSTFVGLQTTINEATIKLQSIPKC